MIALRNLDSVAPLDKQHDRSRFDCGIPALNHYLQRQARQDMLRNVGVVFVLPDTQQKVLGFYTLSAYSVTADLLPAEMAKKLPRYDRLPAIMLGRLAVDVTLQGKKIGQFLLMDALQRTLTIAKSVGAIALTVEAKDTKAASFYSTFGFIPFGQAVDNSTQTGMFLTMRQIADLFPA